MPDLSEGAVFAGHRIEGVAGRGGMGTVYRATHLVLDHLVALKVISPDLATNDSFRERFKLESRIAVSLRHPNVVPIHHAGEEDGLLFVTMDLIDGPDLRKLLISRGALHPERAVEILGAVAAALDVAHSRGLVHRDIKPGNVLISESGEGGHVYLTDFGLTKRMHQASEATGLTSTGAFVGTLDYVAPEQIRGDELDARTDVYALGCVLYEMLGARAPFSDREEKVAKMYAHLQDLPAELGGELSPFDEVVRRAIAKDADDRYPSAGDLARAAAAALEGREVEMAERSVAVGPAAPTAAYATPAEPIDPPLLDPMAETHAPADTVVSGRTEEAVSEPPPATQPRAAVPARSDSGRRSPLAPLGLALAVALALVVAGVLVLGGGGDGGTDGAADAPAAAFAPAPVGEPIGGGGGLAVGVAAAGDDVYVANRDERQLTRGSAAGFTSEPPVRLPGEPEAVAVAGDAVFVTVPDRGSVLRFDRDLGDRSEIELGGRPMGIAADGDAVWVADEETGAVTELLEDGTEGSTFGTGARRAFGIAPTEDSLWVTDRDADSVLRVDRDSTQIDSFDVGRNPKGVAVAGGRVWVANTESGDVTVLDERSGKAEQTLRLGGIPRDVAALGEHVWVSNGERELGDSGTVAVFDAGDLSQPVDPVAVGGSPEGLTAGASLIWVADGPGGEAMAISPTGGAG